MGGNVQEFTDDNFQAEVFDSDQLVLVDFWATWCAPCLKMGPTIDELADEYAGRVKIGKLNTQDHQNTAAHEQVRGLPTVVLYKNGEPVDRVMGLQPKNKLVELINKHADAAAAESQAG